MEAHLKLGILYLCFVPGMSGCDTQGENGPVHAGGGQDSIGTQAKPTAQDESRINSALLGVIQRMQVAGITRENLQKNELEAFSTPFVRVSSTGEIQVYIHLLTVNEASLETLKAHDVRIEISNPGLRIIQGWVPFDVIESLGQLDIVERIDAPGYSYPHDNSARP